MLVQIVFGSSFTRLNFVRIIPWYVDCTLLSLLIETSLLSNNRKTKVSPSCNSDRSFIIHDGLGIAGILLRREICRDSRRVDVDLIESVWESNKQI